MVTRVEPNPQLDGIAEDMRRIAKERRLDLSKALDFVLEELRMQTGMLPNAIANLREKFIDYDLKVMIQRSEESAERKRRAREDEHSHEVFVEDKPQVATSGERTVSPSPREGWMDRWEREHDR